MSTTARIRLASTALLLYLLTSCAGGPKAADPEAPPETAKRLSFVLVRHAEKAEAPAADPPLTPAGRARAARLAAVLAVEPMVAVYSTDYARTRHTATPTAAAHDLALSLYDARLPAREFAARLIASHRTGMVLVVGHSNTIPELASELSAQVVPPLAENRYDHVYRISLQADGTATLARQHY